MHGRSRALSCYADCPCPFNPSLQQVTPTHRTCIARASSPSGSLLRQPEVSMPRQSSCSCADTPCACAMAGDAGMAHVCGRV